jgi:plastocyanin
MKKILSILLVLFCAVSAMAQTIPTLPSGMTIQSQGPPAPGGITVTPNIYGPGVGLAYRGSFSDTTAANVNPYYKNIAGMTIRTGNTLWIRDTTKTQWIEFGAGSLFIDTTESIILRGDGSPPNPLTANLQISQQSGNILQVFPDGAYATTQTQVQNGLISGGLVVWQQNLTYIVTPATYAIGGIVYNSPQTTITLDNADPTDARFDAFVVTTSSTATNITGTPSTDPQNPSYDPTTQLPLTFVHVTANMTEPAFCRDSIYYVSNGETWTGVVSNTGRINTTSTNNPYSVPEDVEFTLARNNDQYRVTKSVTASFATYSVLTFQIRSKATWPANSRVNIRAYSGLTPLGINVALGDGIFGFNSSITNAYQLIAIPVGNLGGGLTTADNILFTVSTTSNNTIGFYLDDIQLLGCDGTPIPVTGRFWSQGGDVWGTTGVIGTLDNNPMQQRVNNINHTILNANGTTGMQGTNPGISFQLNSFANADYFIRRSSNILVLNTGSTIENRISGTSVYSLSTANGALWGTSMQLNSSNNLLLSSTGSLVNNASTIFNVTSTTKASHPFPSMTTAQKNAIVSPQTADLVYDASLANYYYWDGAAWQPFGATVTASEGLSKSTNDIQIGGSAFTANRSILTSAFNLTMTSSNTAIGTLKVDNSSSGNGLWANSTTGSGVLAVGGAYGVAAFSAAGSGVQAGSDTGIPLDVYRNTSSTATTVRIANLLAQSTGTAANGFGGYIEFETQTSTGNQPVSNQLISRWTNATHAARVSEFSITGVNAGTTATKLVLAGSGALRLNTYGSGTFTGTATFALSVDASGNIIETAAGAAALTNPMTTLGDIITGGVAGTPARLGIGTNGDVLTVVAGIPVWLAPGVGGTVTSVGWTGGIVSIATATTTPAFTIAGTSGGIPYFSSSSTWASSAALAANAIVIGGGAGVAPSTTTTASGILTFIGTPSSANLRTAVTDESGTGALYFQSGDLGTPTAGTISTGVTLGDVTMNVTGTDATGDLYYRSAGGILTRLALGTSGQVLSNNGTIPTWQTISGSGTVTSITLTQPAAGITITNSGVALTTTGTRTFALANDLAAVEGLATTGIVRRTGTDTWTAGTLVSLTTEVTGTLPVANGGTGQTSYTNGQLLIGNGTTLTKATLTGTANQINVTNGVGSITLSMAFNPTEQTLTDGATVTWNVTNGGNSVWTNNGSGRTLTLSNVIAGYSYTLRLIQGAGGSHTVTTWTNVKWANATPPTLTTTAGATDMITLYAITTTSFVGYFTPNVQ